MMYHNISVDAFPEAGKPARWAQLYFLSTHDQYERRRQITPSFEGPLLRSLQECLLQNNRWIGAFRVACDIFQTRPNQALQVVLGDDLSSLPRNEWHVYNLPVLRNYEDIAAVIPSGYSSGLHRHVTLHNGRSGLITHISDMSALYDPARFILMFPFGTVGWAEGMKRFKRHSDSSATPTNKRLTMDDFYGYRLMDREGEFNIVNKAGILGQEYIIDAYIKAEGNRLRAQKNIGAHGWIRSAQRVGRFISLYRAHTLPASAA